MNSNSVTVSKTITLNVPRQVLWQFLSDTDRLNKAVGLPAIEFAPHPDPAKKGYYSARARIAGITLAYEELPYNWVDSQYFRIIRRFDKAYLKEIGTHFTFRSVPGGTELDLKIWVAPKSLLTTVITNVILARLAFKDVFRTAKEFERQYKQPAPEAPPAYELMYSVNRNELEHRFRTLQSFSVEHSHIDLFRQHIIHGSDIDVVRMRPFELASKWNTDRFDTLQAFIQATKAGIFDLHWTVLCPNCRGVSSDALTLAEIKSENHCDTCGIYYGADLTSSIEARFTVHPSIRLARHETYCIGGPANLPQILSQLRILPQQHHVESIHLPPGIVRLRSFQAQEIYSINVSDISSETAITAICEDSRLRVNRQTLKSGNISLEIRNSSASEALIVVERESWRDNAATAAIVTSMQEFRDLFPSEAVAPGSELGIASIAVLFTDLRGSTALYKTIGDTKAFEFVQNHFRFLTESVSKHHGGILKTMGDAIMASFSSGLDAVQAALEMQKEWNTFRNEYGNYKEVALKIGIHEGSAIAINNKGKLDYFGTTVNIAGRLQKFSRGGDIIISESILSFPEIQTLLGGHSNISSERFTAELKGLEQEEHTLQRIIVE